MRINLGGVVGEIESLPGCSQIAISHSVFLDPKMRGAGLGKRAGAKRKEVVFDELAYDAMICTVCSENAKQKHILLENGWIFLSSFLSRKTGHNVELWFCRP